MQKLTYSLITAIASFIVGVGVVMLWLYLVNLPLMHAPTEETTIILRSTDFKSPQDKVHDSPSVLTEPGHLPCSVVGADPSKPWEHNHKVLSSYPPDSPLPEFIGRFRDRNWNYELDLYRDAKSIFGEISSPVLEADSPTSRLYGLSFVPLKGTLQFTAFLNHLLQFDGFLQSGVIKGKVTQYGRTETVTLRKLKMSDENSWIHSRAQFDCAMKLFRRY